MPGHNNFVRLPQNPVAVPIVVTTLLLYLIYLYPIVLIVLLPLYKYLFTVPIDVTNKDDDDSDKNKGTTRKIIHRHILTVGTVYCTHTSWRRAKLRTLRFLAKT